MISIPLSEYLDLIWRYHGKAIIPEEARNRIILEPDYKALCHLEFGGNTSEEPLNPEVIPKVSKVWTVWRRKEWDIAYEKYLLDKKNSDIRVAAYNAQKAKIVELGKALIEITGIEEKDAMIMAEGIVKKGKKTLAKMYGVEI